MKTYLFDCFRPQDGHWGATRGSSSGAGALKALLAAKVDSSKKLFGAGWGEPTGENGT